MAPTALRRRGVTLTVPEPAARNAVAPALCGAALRAIERAFDRMFGAQANPWRHLGALSFFLFWIVVASGIYVYAFFDPSAAGAFRSVEALAREQPYMGGVARSLHRYASDAFALTVVLHLVRELALGHFRGFRWFSWLSGVPLIWLMIASGVGGYWLVWDELAQFVAIATTEWLDWLPAFGEPLVRNFVAPEAVTDRLFTLLMFLHIGIPLLLLAGMFVHIQRVNYADVGPARALASGTVIALVALSVAKPALSHGAANLALAPQALALDWFYLFFYPLLYGRSAGELWAWAAGLTLLLLLLPAARRGAREPVAEVSLANCNGCARCFADCPYAAIVMRPREGGSERLRAVVLPGWCASCGICAGACPSSTPFRRGEKLVTGIDMPQRPVNALREALERALEAPAPAPRVVAFGCDRAAPVGPLEQPGVTAFGLICVSMLPPSFIEYALRDGADGVLVAACREGECAYRTGERLAVERFAGRREPHLRANVPPARVRLVHAGEGEEAELARALDEFRAELARLPRLAIRPAARWRARHAGHPVKI